MTWCHWTLVLLVGGPIAMLLAAIIGLVVVFLLPDDWFLPWRPERACGQCGRYGPWVERSSVGAFLCVDCAPVAPPSRLPAGPPDKWHL